MTIATVNMAELQNHLETVFSSKLKDIQAPWIQYNFCHVEKLSPPDKTQTNALFGTVISHVSSGNDLTSEGCVTLFHFFKIPGPTKPSTKQKARSIAGVLC